MISNLKNFETNDVGRDETKVIYVGPSMRYKEGE
jgi:hypothetical protein